MLGPQTEIEIRIWCDEFARMRQTPEWTDAAMDAADDLLHRYRARYGQSQPTAPPAVWYDEPPFAKDGQSYPCWIYGEDDACAVYWSEFAMSPLWVYLMPGEARPVPLNGRRVSPIAKPQEPPQ